MNSYKVVHLVRQVSSTSMPWNDLYATHRSLDRFSAGYVCSISNVRSSGLHYDKNTKQRFLCLNFITALFVLYKIVVRNKRNNCSILVHVHNMSLIPYAIFLRLIGAKFVLNIHNSLVNFNFIQYSLLKLGLPFANAVIPVSQCVGGEVTRTFPKIQSKTYPIRNGIHTEQLVKVNDLRSYSTKNIDVIIIARFVEQKNVSRVLAVLSLCQNLKKVVWYGEGVEMARAVAEVEQGAQKSIFEFRGVKPRKEVLKAIDQSKIYLSLSKWEGLGVANIEALSLPTEVILSLIPPHNELFSDDNLTLVDLETSDMAIAEVIDSKLSSSAERASFLLSRSAVIRQEYDLRTLISKYIDVYMRLVDL